MAKVSIPPVTANGDMMSSKVKMDATENGSSERVQFEHGVSSQSLNVQNADDHDEDKKENDVEDDSSEESTRKSDSGTDKYSMSSIPETKIFVADLKRLSQKSSSWKEALGVLCNSDERFIDYFIYLGGLDPLLNFLNSNKEKRTTIRLANFLLRAVSGFHICQDLDLKKDICERTEFLLSHSSGVVRAAITKLHNTLKESGIVEKGDHSTKPLRKVSNCEESEVIHDKVHKYGSEINGKWAYLLAPDFGVFRELEYSISPDCTSSSSNSSSSSSSSSSNSVIDTSKFIPGKSWVFCKVLDFNDSQSKHQIKLFGVIEKEFLKEERERNTIDEKVVELILNRSNIRFLSDEEGEDTQRLLFSNKQEPEGCGADNEDSSKSTSHRESKPGDVARSGTFPKKRYVATTKTIKERLAALDQTVVRMHVRQWQAAQAPLRRPRRGTTRSPTPIFLARTLNKEPCIETLAPYEEGLDTVLGLKTISQNKSQNKQQNKYLEERNVMKNAAVLKQKLSLYPGVNWSKHQHAWRASTFEGCEHRHIGFFDSEQEAWRAVYTFREASKWRIIGPPPRPLPEGNVEPPQENRYSDQRCAFPGVSWSARGQIWKAETGYRGIRVSLGTFNSSNMAWRAVCAKRRHLRWPAKSAGQHRVGALKKKSKKTIIVDTKMVNRSSKRRQHSPTLGPGLRKYVSWNMFQKLHRGRQVTSHEWRAYNTSLGKRPSEPIARNKEFSWLPSPADTSQGKGNRRSTKPVDDRGRKRHHRVASTGTGSETKRVASSPRTVGRPKNEKVPQPQKLKQQQQQQQLPKHTRNFVSQRRRESRSSHPPSRNVTEKAKPAKKEATKKSGKSSLSTKELYDRLGEYQDHFLEPSSALIWLMSASPTKFRRLLVPPRFRMPESHQGTGGYATAFERLQLVVTEADKSGSRWHRWYAGPHVSLENIQVALRKRLEEAVSMQEKMDDTTLIKKSVSKSSESQAIAPSQNHSKTVKKENDVTIQNCAQSPLSSQVMSSDCKSTKKVTEKVDSINSMSIEEEGKDTAIARNGVKKPLDLSPISHKLTLPSACEKDTNAKDAKESSKNKSDKEKEGEGDKEDATHGDSQSRRGVTKITAEKKNKRRKRNSLHIKDADLSESAKAIPTQSKKRRSVTDTNSHTTKNSSNTTVSPVTRRKRGRSIEEEPRKPINLRPRNKRMTTSPGNVDNSVRATIKNEKNSAKDSSTNAAEASDTSTETPAVSASSSDCEEPHLTNLLQGKWESSYQGIRTDPCVTGKQVLFRNGTKYAFMHVGKQYTIDGIWALDRQVSTNDMMVWRHIRRKRAEPVLWTRKEMPSRKAKQSPKSHHNNSNTSVVGQTKKTAITKVAALSTPPAELDRKFQKSHQKHKDDAATVSNTKEDDTLAAAAESTRAMPRNHVKTQQPQNKVPKGLVDYSKVSNPPQSGMKKNLYEPTATLKSKNQLQLARKSLPKEDLAPNTQQQQHKMKRRRNVKAKTMHSQGLMTPPMNAGSNNIIGQVDRGLERSSVNGEAADLNVMAVAQLLASFQQQDDNKLEDDEDDADDGHEGNQYQPYSHPEEEEEDRITSMHQDDDRSIAGFDNYSENDDSPYNDGTLTRQQGASRIKNRHCSSEDEIAASRSTSNHAKADFYPCFGCGGEIMVLEGQDTVECERCGNKAMSYRYTNCSTAVANLLRSAERQFTNSVKGFRGYNRHGHGEWVEERK